MGKCFSLLFAPFLEEMYKNIILSLLKRPTYFYFGHSKMLTDLLCDVGDGGVWLDLCMGGEGSKGCVCRLTTPDDGDEAGGEDVTAEVAVLGGWWYGLKYG